MSSFEIEADPKGDPMGSMTKAVAVAACALFLQIGMASADPATTDPKSTPKVADNACPKGQVEGPDGVCVLAKKGRMGFDLAAPGDNDSAPSQSNNNNNSRSVSSKSH
jgi:hypothetical protein